MRQYVYMYRILYYVSDPMHYLYFFPYGIYLVCVNVCHDFLIGSRLLLQRLLVVLRGTDTCSQLGDILLQLVGPWN